jgi:transposase
MVTVYADEWQGYGRLPEIGRYRSAVCHVAGDWARDDDGDGVREVHCNTEGIWTLPRNFPRPFRGGNKEYLHQYAAIFQWGYKIIKRVTGGVYQVTAGSPRSHQLTDMSQVGKALRRGDPGSAGAPSIGTGRARATDQDLSPVPPRPITRTSLVPLGLDLGR